MLNSVCFDIFTFALLAVLGATEAMVLLLKKLHHIIVVVAHVSFRVYGSSCFSKNTSLLCFCFVSALCNRGNAISAKQKHV